MDSVADFAGIPRYAYCPEPRPKPKQIRTKRRASSQQAGQLNHARNCITNLVRATCTFAVAGQNLLCKRYSYSYCSRCQVSISGSDCGGVGGGVEAVVVTAAVAGLVMAAMAGLSLA